MSCKTGNKDVCFDIYLLYKYRLIFFSAVAARCDEGYLCERLHICVHALDGGQLYKDGYTVVGYPPASGKKMQCTAHVSQLILIFS